MLYGLTKDQRKVNKDKLARQALAYKAALQEFVSVQKCRNIMVPNKLTNTKFRIFISQPRIVKGGLFGGSHVVFKVQTRPFKFDTERRFSDFLWLRKMLVMNFPTCFVPPLPSKDGRRNFDQFYLHKRMLALQMFIDGVSEHKMLRSSEFFLDFLKIGSLQQWTKRKVHLEEMGKAKPTSVSEISI